MSDPSGNGWDEYKKHVLYELERIHNQQTKFYDHLSTVRSDIASLKAKAGIWGLLGGLVPVVIALALAVMKGMMQ